MRGFTRVPTAFLCMASVCFLLHFGMAMAQQDDVTVIPPITISYAECVQVAPGNDDTSVCGQCKQRSDYGGSGWCFSYKCDPGGTKTFKTCVYKDVSTSTCTEISAITVDPCQNCKRWGCEPLTFYSCDGCPCTGDGWIPVNPAAHWKSCP